MVKKKIKIKTKTQTKTKSKKEKKGKGKKKIPIQKKRISSFEQLSDYATYLARKTGLPSDCYVALKLFRVATIKKHIRRWLNCHVFDYRKKLLLEAVSMGKKENPDKWALIVYDRQRPERALINMRFEHLCGIIGYVEMKTNKYKQTHKSKRTQTDLFKEESIWTYLREATPDSTWTKKLSAKEIKNLQNWKDRFRRGINSARKFGTYAGSGIVRRSYGATKGKRLMDVPHKKKKKTPPATKPKKTTTASKKKKPTKKKKKVEKKPKKTIKTKPKTKAKSKPKTKKPKTKSKPKTKPKTKKTKVTKKRKIEEQPKTKKPRTKKPKSLKPPKNLCLYRLNAMFTFSVFGERTKKTVVHEHIKNFRFGTSYPSGAMVPCNPTTVMKMILLKYQKEILSSWNDAEKYILYKPKRAKKKLEVTLGKPDNFIFYVTMPDTHDDLILYEKRHSNYNSFDTLSKRLHHYFMDRVLDEKQIHFIIEVRTSLRKEEKSKEEEKEEEQKRKEEEEEEEMMKGGGGGEEEEMFLDIEKEGTSSFLSRAELM